MAFAGRIGPDLSTKLPQRAPETAGLCIIYIFRILKGMLLGDGLRHKRTDRKKFFLLYRHLNLITSRLMMLLMT